MISSLLKNFSSYEIVQHAFGGIRVALAVLVVNSVWKLYKKGVKGALANGIFVSSLLLLVVFDLSPVWIVLALIMIAVIGTKKGAIK